MTNYFSGVDFRHNRVFLHMRCAEVLGYIEPTRNVPRCGSRFFLTVGGLKKADAWRFFWLLLWLLLLLVGVYVAAVAAFAVLPVAVAGLLW
jgi:hypothetical protein